MSDSDMRIQLHRQFAIAQYLYNNITEEDKERLLFDPDTGRWSGYKHPFGFKVRHECDEPGRSSVLTLPAIPQCPRWYRAIQLVQSRLEGYRADSQVSPPVHGRDRGVLQLSHEVSEPSTLEAVLACAGTTRRLPVGQRAVARQSYRRRLLPPCTLPTSA